MKSFILPLIKTRLDILVIKVITDLSPLYRFAQKISNMYCLASLKSTCARVTTNLGLRAIILLTYVYTH